jgi:hypothetical protein
LFDFFCFLQLQLIFIHLSRWQWCKCVSFHILFQCISIFKIIILIFLSNCQGLHNNRCAARIETTSYKILFLYLSTENENKTYLVTITFAHSFNHRSLYSVECLLVVKFNFLTKFVLVTLIQIPLSMIMLYTLFFIRHLL